MTRVSTVGCRSPASPSGVHLALNVYVWDRDAQDLLLVQGLGSAVRALVRSGAIHRLWLHRFDVRGPHVMLVLGTPPEEGARVKRCLSKTLREWMTSHPCTTVLEDDELQRRHRECRGRALNPIDRRPGFAANNSFAWASQDPRTAYVFRKAVGIDPIALETLLMELSLWSLTRLATGARSGCAVAWVAGLTQAFQAQGVDPEPFWRFYASTLLLSLSVPILDLDPAVVSRLPHWVGPHNMLWLDHAWRAAGAGASNWEGFPILARLVETSNAEASFRHAFVRELCHSVFAQLSLWVSIRIPIVLYAWHRTLQG